MSKKDKPRKRRHAPPTGKNPQLTTWVIYAMLGLTLASVVFSLLGGGMDQVIFAQDATLPVTIVSIVGTLFGGLVFLKFVSPGWEPHRKVLGWLLGGTLLLRTAGLAAMVVVAFITEGVEVVQGVDASGADLATADLHRTIVIVTSVVISVFVFVISVLLSPEFHLLRGLWRKKSTEKTAGVLSAIMLGFSILMLLGVVAESDTGTLAVLSMLPAILILLGQVIVYFSWPVLDKPISETEHKEKNEEAADERT